MNTKNIASLLFLIIFTIIFFFIELVQIPEYVDTLANFNFEFSLLVGYILLLSNFVMSNLLILLLFFLVYFVINIFFIYSGSEKAKTLSVINIIIAAIFLAASAISIVGLERTMRELASLA